MSDKQIVDVSRLEAGGRTNLWLSALGYFVIYCSLIGVVIITFFPFWYMVVLSTKNQSQIFSFPPPMLFSADIFENVTGNYTRIMAQIPFWRNLWNSFYISSMSVLLTLFLCSLSGYGFALFEFKGKNVLFAIMIATLMIPQIVNIIPFFAMMKAFGWLNTPKALYIPSAANAFGIFLIKQYVESAIPKDLQDSARIDGCSEFGIFWRIVLPLIKPGLGALGIITFLNAWNNFFQALVVMTKKESYTIPVALSMLRTLRTIDYGGVMLGTSIAILPIILVFFMMSKMIIAKITEGALKG
jgi:multiple sugar transport system permease protein